jgi:hypothetical protein
LIVAFKYIEWVMRCRVASIRGVSWELTGQKSCLTGHHDRRNMNRYFEFWNHCILLVRFSKKVMLENIAVSLSEFRNCFPRSISWFAMSMSQFRQSLCPMSLFHFLYVVNQGNVVKKFQIINTVLWENKSQPILKPTFVWAAWSAWAWGIPGIILSLCNNENK